MSAIEEIKERIDIVELVGQYTQLKKSGRTFKGRCPFHNERTASFVVYPDDWSYHCFGCHVHGNGFDLMMSLEKLSFSEALQRLAERAGVAVTPRRSKEEDASRQQIDRLRQMHEATAQYYHHLLLNSSQASAARAYVEKRGFLEATVKQFQLGYAPASWEALLGYLHERGYGEEELLRGGLVVSRESGGCYDRFRDRLIFPIRDRDGHMLGFGARALDNSVPKYLNSPQTPLFDKSAILYGIQLARPFMEKQNQVIIVEGYVDVITAHQHGVQNVVAAMGTALTERQVGILKRLTKSVVLALDADAAGEGATLRGLDVARGALDQKVVPVPTWRGIIRYTRALDADIKIAALPRGQDPDDVIRADPTTFTRLIDQSLPIMDFLLTTKTADLDLSRSRDKAKAAERLLPYIGDLPDPVEQAHYRQRLARLLQVDERALEQAARQSADESAAGKGRPATREQAQPAMTSPGDAQEEYCLALLLQRPTLKPWLLQIRAEEFRQVENRQLFFALKEVRQIEKLREDLDPVLHKHLDHLLALPLPAGAPPEKAMASTVQRLRLRNLRQDMLRIAHLQRESLEGGDAVQTEELQQRSAELASAIHAAERASPAAAPMGDIETDQSG
ncbi:MAG: DNA primase [Chloroflexota bacterium]|nr:MAG: DNA primase [Chloroflexota bacterium]